MWWDAYSEGLCSNSSTLQRVSVCGNIKKMCILQQINIKRLINIKNKPIRKLNMNSKAFVFKVHLFDY